MNARAVGRLAGKNIAQMAEMVHQWQARLVKAARALPNLGTTVMIRGDGAELSAQQRLETTARHWREHLEELQALSAA
jgi:hypothetical protein